MVDLIVHFRWIENGLRDLVVQEGAIPFAHPEDHHAERSLRDLQLGGELSVASPLFSPGQEGLQFLELGALALGLVVLGQALHHPAQEPRTPLAFVEDFRSGAIVGRQAGETGFALLGIDGNVFDSTPTLLRRARIPVAGQQVFGTTQEIGPKAPALRGKALEGIAFDQVHHERLGEILGILHRAATTPQKGVEGWPVVAAEALESLISDRAIGARRRDETPASSRETSPFWWIGRGVVRIVHLVTNKTNQ